MFIGILFRLKSSERLYLYCLLVLSCLFCFTVSLYRVFLTESSLFFLFLNKNLFLAFIPFAISSYLVLFPKTQQNKYLFLPLILMWLVFFPNAPYIVTDLIHVKPRTDSALWLDLGIVFSFAWTGLIFGIISLMDIEKIFFERIGKVKTSIGITFFLFLTGFAIYLGRYLRWNSWDIIHQPFYLFADVLNRFVFPFDYPRTWGMTILYGSLLNLIYWTIKGLRK